MKSIAIVTMFFLPATFTSVRASSMDCLLPQLRLTEAKTFFSMDFFDWPKAAGAIGTGYIWIYFVVAAVFTLITVGLFKFRGRKNDKDMAGSMV